MQAEQRWRFQHHGLGHQHNPGSCSDPLPPFLLLWDAPLGIPLLRQNTQEMTCFSTRGSRFKIAFFLATSMQKTSISSIFSPWKSHPCLQAATSSGEKHRHFHISFCSSGSYAIHLHYLSWRNQAVYLKKSISCLTFENLCTALVFSLPCLLYNLDFIEMTFQNIDFTQMANKLVFLEENEIYIYIS